jgi:hypothetical protein
VAAVVGTHSKDAKLLTQHRHALGDGPDTHPLVRQSPVLATAPEEWSRRTRFIR